MAKNTPAPLPSSSYHYIRRLFSRAPQRRGWRNARRQTACRNCGATLAQDQRFCGLRARQLREGRWLFPACLSGGPQ